MVQEQCIMPYLSYLSNPYTFPLLTFYKDCHFSLLDSMIFEFFEGQDMVLFPVNHTMAIGTEYNQILFRINNDFFIYTG